MTPKVPNQNQNPSFLDWDPSKNGPAPKETDDCNGRCHPSPKNVPGSPSFQTSNKWFLESLKTDEPSLPPNFPLRNLPPVAPAPPPKVEPKPTVKPGAPADATALNDQAKELERQGRLATDPEQKTHFYQSALSFRLLSGDDSGATCILNELDGIYKKSNNEVGQKLVAATRIWVEGKPDDALKALADMEKESGGAAFNQQYSHHRSMLLQLAAGAKLKAGDYEGGKDLLMKALLQTPTDQLTAKILKLMADHGDADLLKQKKNIENLETQREQTVSRGTPCNTSCHTSTQDKFNDFDFPNLNVPGMAPTPDLTPYRHLKLSYQEKLLLANIDAKIEEARKHLGKSTEGVETLLFVQKLDDPKSDIAEFEAKFLKDAKAFEGPDRSLPWHLAGEAYLAKKDWAKAATALQNAVKEDPSLVDAQFSLGHAQFALGDFKASRDAYTEILKRQPQDVMALRYRADANTQYLTSLDPKLHADEITAVNAELASDKALLMARFAHSEKDKLTQLQKQLELLHEGGDASLESRQGTVDMLELMAKQYLALAETKQPNVASAELVRKEMSGLASQTFELLRNFALADLDPEIKKRAGLYEGYSFLAQGKVDDAVKTFEPYRASVPEIDKILSTLEKNKLRMVNLAALDAWAVYNKEGSRIQADNQNGILGSGIGLIEGAFRSDGKDFRDDTKARWEGQVAFVAELRAKIESGKADTILDAMKLIETNGPESMKADARYYINYEDRAVTGYPLGAMVHLVAKVPPEKGQAAELFRKAWDLERQNSGAIESPYALYTLVNALDTEDGVKDSARASMDALEGNGSFGRSVFKFITSMSPESLAVDVALMVGSAGLGNMAKLAALSRLEKAGVTGYKAVVLAGATGVGVEATALWAANLGKEAMIKDPSKVFTADHMLKSYGATLIMIGGLKGFGALGESVAPRAAKSLGLVTEGGTKLTAGGKVLSWGIGHGMGMSGMIATSHVNQAIGLTPKPVGGWKEGLVHDVFGYVQFAVAHKIADRAFAGKLSTLSNKQHTEIAVKEAIALAKSHADALGFRATRGPKGEIVDSPERQIVVGILVDSALNKPGFSGGKLAKLVEQKKLGEANAYFAEFRLPLEYNKAGDLVAVARGEPSPHEAAGIPAGKAKPPPKPIDVNLFVKSFSEKFGEILDMAAELLFGPPGSGGGMGGLQPILNGGYGTFAPKAEPKGPPAVYMAGRGRGTSKATKTTKAAPAEPANPHAERAANDNQYHEVIGRTLKAGDSIDAVLLALANHYGNPAKIIVINCERPLENPEAIKKSVEAFDAAARIEIHQPGKPPIEVAGKTRMDQIHTDAANDGTMLMWEAGPKSVRELFEIPGKDGNQIFLAKPDGVSRIEIQIATRLSKEDIAYLTTRARDLKVEIEVTVHGGGKMTFESTANGLKVGSNRPTNAEEVNALVDLSVHHGEKIEITTPDGKVEIQNGATAKDSKVFTSEAKIAALAPERIVLRLDKAPNPTELQALKDQGIKNVIFQHDTAGTNWFVESINLMKTSQGLNIRAVDPSGKFLWENVVKPNGETLNASSEIFIKGLALHAKNSGWTDRLAETRKLLGTEGQRFQFAGEALRWAASHDISDASIPKGKTEPAITPEQVDTWIKRGTELAVTKQAKAREKGRDRLAAELAPFAEGLSLDSAKTGGWNKAVDGLKAYLAKDPRNAEVAGKLFELLNREPTSSSAYENNAYDLANHLATSENPHSGIRDLLDFAQNSTGLLKIEGSYFGSFFKASTDTGARAEVDTFYDLVSQAGAATAKGQQVVIEAIPTSKLLEGTTPDIAVTVTSGTVKSKYFVEIKRAGRETIIRSGGNAKEFISELEAGFSGNKSNDSTLGSLIGKGLFQLGNYKGTDAGDYLVLNVRMGGEPPTYFETALKQFLKDNCPGVVVKVQYESAGTPVTATLRAEGSTRYSAYDANTNIFAPSLTTAASK